MQIAPQFREKLAFYAFCAITTMAMVERLAEVVNRLWLSGIGPGALTFILMLSYAAYLYYLNQKLSLADHWLDRHAHWSPILFLTIWLCLGVLFYFLYPLADSGALGFMSDRDEALDIGVKQLWQGHYPYYCRVAEGVHAGCPSEGNLIGPMPGALILASPVVFIFSQSAALSWLTLGLTYLVLWYYWGNSARATSYLLRLILAAPIVSAEILTGGDLLANSLFVSIPLLLLVGHRKGRFFWVWPVLLGIALSWRGVFWLLVFPVGIYILRRQEWRPFLGLGLVVLLAFLSVTLPFVLWDFANFAPWHIQQRFDRYNHILPYAGMLVPLAMIWLGCYWGWRVPNLDALFHRCGWILLITVLAAAVFNSIELQYPTLLFYGWYALADVIFLTLPAKSDSVAA